MARTALGRGEHQYRLIVPLDASSIENFRPEQRVKVAVQDRTGALHSQLVELDSAGRGRVTFTFAAHPGTLVVRLGPHNATDQDLTRLQTITVNVPARQWGERTELTLPAIRIAPYYWYWWLVWCREFTIRGVVVCPNGQPVPGANVCAYDVDWWWWWSSTQLIKCATTDASGAFEIKFTWCCGWWPWWWWAQRFWRLEPTLVERIAPLLGREPELARLVRPTPQPSLADFRQLLGADAAAIGNAPTIDPAALPGLRSKLLARLPAAAELERLRIWPWWPWWPWWDCAPDVIFRVTQNCAPTAAGGSTVILDETIWDTRWDIPTNLNVTLVVGDNACCVPQSHPCEDGECLALTGACDEQAGFGRLDNIGGNTGALASPVGYESPGAGITYSDRPYAGAVSIFGTADCMDGVDYYEFEWNTSLAPPNDPSWKTMPPAANGDFVRSYLQFVPFSFFNPTFSASVPIDGHHVYETLQHYEAGHPPGDWNSNRIWIGNRDQLIWWLTENNFTDGTYYLHVKGWNIDGGGHLINPRVLNICASENPNYIVLRVDNRFVGPGPTDLHGNPCNNVVHYCTNEPDTAFANVHIRRADSTVIPLAACGSEHVTAADTLVIDFVAYDPDGHLGEFELQLHYDVNLVTDLLSIGTLSTGAPWGGVPAAGQSGPNYHDALLQGAGSPTWQGGVLHLEVPATGPGGAFPYTCCYLLKLNAFKRTIVNCSYSRDGQANSSEYSFTIIV